jgi:hypothetical protein
LNSDIEERKHYQETLNLQTLAHMVGIGQLRAPIRQNETTDVIMLVDDQEVNVSVKTATPHHRGYTFGVGGHPNDHLCHIVLAFYKNADGIRTHVSVLCPRRVYACNKYFTWSPTHNKDVLKGRVDLQSDKGCEHLYAAIKREFSL